MEFTKEKAGQYGESEGTAKLYVNDKEVATGPMKAQVKFTLVGDGLCSLRLRRPGEQTIQITGRIYGRYYFLRKSQYRK